MHPLPEEDTTRHERRFPPRELEVALPGLLRLPRLLVSCDFDGTLAPFVARPELARLPAAASAALRRLARTPGVRVAVVSSRALRDLSRRVRIPGVWLAGSSGLETRTAAGVVRRYSDARAFPAALRRELELWCTRHPGAWLEVKPRSLAVHYRALPGRRHAAFVAGVRRRVVRLAPRLRLVTAARACEVLPASGRDKATVLAEWSRGLPRGAVLWLGDDAPDEPAHAWVRRHGGLAVVIGRRRSVAPYRLRSPREVTRLLVWLAHARPIAARGLNAGDPARSRRRDPATRRRDRVAGRETQCLAERKTKGRRELPPPR